MIVQQMLTRLNQMIHEEATIGGGQKLLLVWESGALNPALSNNQSSLRFPVIASKLTQRTEPEKGVPERSSFEFGTAISHLVLQQEIPQTSYHTPSMSMDLSLKWSYPGSSSI